MKNIDLPIILILTIISCSNDQDDLRTLGGDNFKFKEYFYKSFDPSSGEKMDSIKYMLTDEGKLESYSGTNNGTSISGIVNYANNNITSLESYSGGKLQSKWTYLYENQNLAEVLVEYTQGSTFMFSKTQYTYTEDTILVTQKSSTDGVIFDIEESNSKIILDDRGNRTYYEVGDSASQIEFDSNNNPISETHLFDSGMGLVPRKVDRITHLDSKNTLYEIYERTYGKQILMLTYHLLDSYIGRVNPKNISPNNVDTYEIDFSHIYSFEINNEIASNNYAVLNSYKTYDVPRSKIISHIEFSFIPRD